MTLRLKTRLTLAITLLVLVVLGIVSFYTILNVTHELIRETYEKGDLIAKQIYEQVKQALSTADNKTPPSPADAKAFSLFVSEILMDDPGLDTLLQSTSGYSHTILYLAVTDATGFAMAHTDALKVRQTLPPVEDFNQLLAANPLEQLRIVYGQARIYEVRMPMFDTSKKPFGTVHVAMNTAFLEKELDKFFTKNLRLAVAVLALATALAALFSHFLLSPLTFISAGVERLIHGELDKPIKMARRDEFGLVSLKLNEIRHRLEFTRDEIDTLKGNIGQIVKTLEEKLIFINPEKHIILLSPSAASLINTTVENSIGRPINQVLQPDHPLLNLIETAFGVKRDLTKDRLYVPSLDKAITVRIHFLEENHRSMGALVILQDPETVAKLESQLEYANKLSALSRLSSGVAHEVKNPLNAIVIHLELLRSGLSDSSPESHKSLGIITQEIKRLDRVVRNFLNFNRPIEVRLQETDIQPIIHDVVNLAETEAKQCGVQIVVENHNRLPTVRLDRDLIRQCLLNIVLNGCQAMPQGGDLTIASQPRSGVLEINIRDTGVGIPPQDREKVFNLYYTTKENGNGIGLATVFKIVQLHNGEIVVDSEAGKGTTFTVKLPLA
jgi:signal transduction histidine kinase